MLDYLGTLLILASSYKSCLQSDNVLHFLLVHGVTFALFSLSCASFESFEAISFKTQSRIEGRTCLSRTTIYYQTFWKWQWIQHNTTDLFPKSASPFMFQSLNLSDVKYQKWHQKPSGTKSKRKCIALVFPRARSCLLNPYKLKLKSCWRSSIPKRYTCLVLPIFLLLKNPQTMNWRRHNLFNDFKEMMVWG
jgi:hypothetical protein